MESPQKYWWIVLIVVPVVVALIRILPKIFPPSKRKKQKDVEVPKTKDSVSPMEGKIEFEIPVISLQLKQLYDEACTLKEDGAYHGALKKLDDIISIRVDYVNAYLMKGRIYLEKLKQYSKAIDEFRRGLVYDPNNKYLLYDLGLTYYYLVDLKQAINYNEKALNQDPDLIMAIYNNAIYHVDYGKKYNDDAYYRKAIELYENVIERDQDCVAWAMFNLACLYARLSKQAKDSITRSRYPKMAVELLDRSITKEGPEGLERLKKVTGVIRVPYGEDLDPIRRDLNYKTMIKKWKKSLNH